VVWLALPVIYLWLARIGKVKQHKTRESKPAKWSKFLSRRPYVAVIFAIIMAVLAVLALRRLPTGFLPQMDTGTIVLDYSSPPGSSLAATVKMLNKVDKILLNNPAVANYSRRTG